MDSQRYTSNSPFAGDQVSHSKRPQSTSSPKYDSGLGFLYSSMEPQRPKLVGGAAPLEEAGEESGIFSGDIYTETDSAVAVDHPTQVAMDDVTVETTSKAFEDMSVSNTLPPQQREVMTVVRTDKPSRQPTKTRNGRPGKMRRPHRNYSNLSMGSRSTSPQSLSQEQSANQHSGVFSNSHMSLPQSWETSGYNSHSGSLSSVDMFSGSSDIGTSGWPSIDIFELQQNVQYFLPNRDGDT